MSAANAHKKLKEALLSCGILPWFLQTNQHQDSTLPNVFHNMPINFGMWHLQSYCLVGKEMRKDLSLRRKLTLQLL